MRKIDTTLEDDVVTRLDDEAAARGVSRATLIREIIEDHCNGAAAAPVTHGAHDLAELRAMIEAVAKYLCVSRPIDINQHLLPEEEQSIEFSLNLWRQWIKQ